MTSPGLFPFSSWSNTITIYLIHNLLCSSFLFPGCLCLSWVVWTPRASSIEPKVASILSYVLCSIGTKQVLHQLLQKVFKSSSIEKKFWTVLHQVLHHGLIHLTRPMIFIVWWSTDEMSPARLHKCHPLFKSTRGVDNALYCSNTFLRALLH